MKIVADENIAQLAATFGLAGELVALPGRMIDADAVRDADALLVRSVTPVNAQLLKDSRCGFVGTATSGVDHVDTTWLAERNIALASARGCNAWSVVDYVFSVLASMSERDGSDWRTLSYGIVGCGAIGERLARRLLNLGLHVAIYDPFLDPGHWAAQHFTDFTTVLQQDVVTFHTPLTRDGPWPTWHMLDASLLAGVRRDTLLINAARGGVIDNAALLAHLAAHPEQRVVLDAWENEPAILRPLLDRVVFGTAHIAGYSVEGKLRGTQMIADAFSTHFGVQLPALEFPVVRDDALQVDAAMPVLDQLNSLILQVYDIAKDDALLRNAARAANPAAEFDVLRKTYARRQEIAAHTLPSGLAPELSRLATQLGFRPPS